MTPVSLPSRGAKSAAEPLCQTWDGAGPPSGGLTGPFLCLFPQSNAGRGGPGLPDRHHLLWPHAAAHLFPPWLLGQEGALLMLRCVRVCVITKLLLIVSKAWWSTKYIKFFVWIFFHLSWKVTHPRRVEAIILGCRTEMNSIGMAV